MKKNFLCFHIIIRDLSTDQFVHGHRIRKIYSKVFRGNSKRLKSRSPNRNLKIVMPMFYDLDISEMEIERRSRACFRSEKRLIDVS